MQWFLVLTLTHVIHPFDAGDVAGWGKSDITLIGSF